MEHNSVDYWRRIQLLPTDHPDRPTARVCRLLDGAMERWRRRRPWISEHHTGHLSSASSPAGSEILVAEPVPVRKGMAIARMLELVTNPVVAKEAGTFKIHHDELIVGTMPPFSVGQGKEVVRYLTEQEALLNFLNYLDEWGPMGHIVPDHGVVLEVGIDGLIARCEEGRQRRPDRESFYRSDVYALRGVLAYAARYAEGARVCAASWPDGSAERSNMLLVAERLTRVPASRARSFHDAVQAIYLVHCALHTTGEIVPLGRLDQLLYPFYKADLIAGRITPAAAQEIIDCLWIKLGDRAILNRRHHEDRFSFADGPMTGFKGPSNFDQGALLNQWMQQITVGGFVADEAAEPTDGTNDVTYFCLEASRRLPLNSPTLAVRVHSGTPAELIEAAARCLLAGGAHPVLLNDDILVSSLIRSGPNVALKSARNYACDGCFETMLAGETEFSFGFVPAPEVLERALNRGAMIGGAGSTHLRGLKGSWRTPPPEEIVSFEELWAVLAKHIELGLHRFLYNILNLYGEKEGVCPSPLLSALIYGCVETGRDLTGGGARYHMFSPLMTGISTAVDSLYAIRAMVFASEPVCTLDELVSCLRSNWGREPLVHGLYVSPERCATLREVALRCPKYGQGVPEVDALAWRLMEEFGSAVERVRRDPVHAEAFPRLRKRYDEPGWPFDLMLPPGVGTFEQYVGGGEGLGASADGRLRGQPIASDMSPAPIPQDLPAATDSGLGPALRHQRCVPLQAALRSYDNRTAVGVFGDGAPFDVNIREDFPHEELVDALRVFANGRAGSVITFTVCNPETFAAALRDPDGYDLLRVRMGGWSEFFIALFPEHQKQHMRRPLFLAAQGDRAIAEVR